jgi:DNA-binding transcriptional ArsR family regulator
MNRRQWDLLVSSSIGVVLLGGGALTWQALQRQRAMDGMMGSMMGPLHGPTAWWYLLWTVVLAALIGGVYVARRPAAPSADTENQSPAAAAGTAPGPETAGGDDSPVTAGAVDPAAQTRPQVLDLLPADERRILEPVLSSPGITQIELRDRSGFSKSKVSQTVSALEKRGLLSRERQGRTFRVYPSEELTEPA